VAFQQIQAVIFDKDGTLANSELFLSKLGQRRSHLIDAQIPGIGRSLLTAFGLTENQLNPAGMLAVGTRRESEIAVAAYVAQTGRAWVESLMLAHSAFVEADRNLSRKADYTPLIDGSLKLVQALAAVNLKIGILSSDITANVADFAQKYQLADYIQLQMGTDTAITKPDPILFWQACELLGVAPAKTLMIGDSEADIVMARAAGAAGCIGMTGGWTNPVQLTADVAIAHFDEIQISA
jgi:phosphoglycolate phosphatase